jgi:hypothetical protein
VAVAAWKAFTTACADPVAAKVANRCATACCGRYPLMGSGLRSHGGLPGCSGPKVRQG